MRITAQIVLMWKTFLIVLAAQDICNGMFLCIRFKLIYLYNFYVAEMKATPRVLSQPKR